MKEVKEEEPETKPSKRLKMELNLDADDPLDESEAEDSDSDSDDDETAALMAEIQKLKREKAEEQREKVWRIIGLNLACPLIQGFTIYRKKNASVKRKK